MTNNNQVDNFKGFSMAMYSTWLWHRPTRSMFDAGEGISVHMRNYVFAIENIFLSHGHHDHLGGLAGLTLARSAARGDKEKPFYVYHPQGWEKIAMLKDYIDKATNGRSNIVWKAISYGHDVAIDDSGKVIRSFRVNHARNLLCLGYAIVEKRTRLRKDLIGKSGREIADIAAKTGRNSVNEPYEKIVAAYSGDCTPVNPESVKGADVLFHEATFVNEDDMDVGGGHSTVRGAVEVAFRAEVGMLVLYHISTRYMLSDVKTAARKAAKDFGFDRPIKILDGANMIDVV